MTVDDIVKMPALKVLISQLENASLDRDHQRSFRRWTVPVWDGELLVSNVWIQGLVHKCVSNDEIHISDNTGICQVVGLSKISKTKSTSQFVPGESVILIGYVENAGAMIKNGNIVVKVKAMKLTEATGNTNFVLGKQWADEVKNAQAVVVSMKTK